MKKTTLIICAVAIGMVGSAQTKALKKGDKYYSAYSYKSAAKQYELIETKDIDVNRKLASSYTMIGDYTYAEVYWHNVVMSDAAQGNDFLDYSDVLRINGKYAEALLWIAKASPLVPNDPRVSKYISDKNIFDKLQKNESRYELHNLEVNTEEQDFGVCFYGGKVVFASSRKSTKPVDRTWNWNGLPFLDLYEGSITPNHNIADVKLFSTKLNGKFHDGPASFSENGNIMVYTRNNEIGKDQNGVTRLKEFYAEKENGVWSKPKEFAFNSNDYSVGHGCLNAAGNVMYFASDMPGGFGGTDIYKVSRYADGKWGIPMNLGEEINTSGNELFPFYHESGLLFFASNGWAGLGGLDVFVSKAKNDAYEKPNNVGLPINTSYDDFGFVCDLPMVSGYVSSNRIGGKGNDDIYSVQILKPFRFDKIIVIKCLDEKENQIAGATLTVTNAGGVTDTYTSDAEGMIALDASGVRKLTIVSTKSDYSSAQKNFETELVLDGAIIKMVMPKIMGFYLAGSITDGSSSTPLSDVNMEITNAFTKEKKIVKTDEQGAFKEILANAKMDDKVTYSIKLSKDGYLSKSLSYSTQLDHEGKYDLNSSLDLSLEKIALGQDLAKVIDISPIYFDLGKFAIRPDAAKELDKIVEVMNTNPNMEIELGSHTDCRGSSADNKKLSDKRAKASAEYVKKRISRPERIKGKGYGESQLVNSCECEGKNVAPCSEEQHQANRRTEFKIQKL